MQEDGRDLNLPNEHHSLSLTGLIIISGVIILLLFLAISWKTWSGLLVVNINEDAMIVSKGTAPQENSVPDTRLYNLE